MGFLGGAVVENLPVSAGDARDVGSIPGSGSSHGEAHGSAVLYTAWKISWKQEPGGLQSMGSQSQTKLSD